MHRIKQESLCVKYSYIQPM